MVSLRFLHFIILLAHTQSICWCTFLFLNLWPCAFSSWRPTLANTAVKPNISPVTLLKQGSRLKTWRSYFLLHLIIISASAKAAVVKVERKERSLSLPKQLCTHGRLSHIRGLTTKRSCEGANHAQPHSCHHAWASNISLRKPGHADVIAAEIKSLLEVETIFQHLRTQMNFQAKESSNSKQTTQSFQTWSSSDECLVSATRLTKQKLVKCQNLPLRSEGINPFLLKIKCKVSNFKFQPETFHRKLCLLLFFFLNFLTIKIGHINHIWCAS